MAVKMYMSLVYPCEKSLVIFQCYDNPDPGILSQEYAGDFVIVHYIFLFCVSTAQYGLWRPQDIDVILAFGTAYRVIPQRRMKECLKKSYGNSPLVLLGVICLEAVEECHNFF